MKTVATQFAQVVRARPPAQRVGYLARRRPDGADFGELLYSNTLNKAAQAIASHARTSKPWPLHPELCDESADEPRPRQDVTHDRATGRFTVPPRTALVYVVD